MRTTVRSDYTHPELEWAKNSSLVIVTAHRRENLGTPMRGIFRAIRKVVEEKENVKVIFPVHMNPAIREAVYSELLGNDYRAARDHGGEDDEDQRLGGWRYLQREPGRG